MFEWLIDEMASVKTPKFHLVDGPASGELREIILASEIPVPPSYKEFVLKFGNAKLFRMGSVHAVGVFGAPREAETGQGEPLWYFGKSYPAPAYFKAQLLQPGHESPIFEWYHQAGLRKVSDDFETWLRKRCQAARRRYKKRQWEAIKPGPEPFSPEEERIVVARRRYRWRVLGVAPNGDLRFEVHNGSDITLPFLSLGVRGKPNPKNTYPLNGGVWLAVDTLAPGETGIIEKDCYKKLLNPVETEVFELPDPGPEDRERFWEFGRGGGHGPLNDWS
jgi:hypothetical protein